MMWSPKGDSTTSLTAPISSENAAFSNGSTMLPRSNQPRSPPCWAVPWSSLYSRASALKSSPEAARSRISSASANTLSRCASVASSGKLRRMWRALTRTPAASVS